eukprot:symbB.v1.2.017749.t1/scaffold1390.1/size121990/6
MVFNTLRLFPSFPAPFAGVGQLSLSWHEVHPPRWFGIAQRGQVRTTWPELRCYHRKVALLVPAIPAFSRGFGCFGYGV